MREYPVGSEVQWSWGGSNATGHIQKVYTDDVTLTIKGTDVTRHASESKPAYYISQSGGDAVLKSHSEIEKA